MSSVHILCEGTTLLDQRQLCITTILKPCFFKIVLIDRKLEEIIRIPLDSNSDVTEGQLKLLLENPNVSSCKIVPISIVGALKSNGSYILNYCLRYLYAHVSLPY